MRSITKLLLLNLAFLILHSCKEKAVRFEHDFPKQPGYVVFNLGDNTFKNYTNQTVMLFGCNTALTNTSPDWHAPPDFQWNTSDQVLSGISFGPKTSIVSKDTVNYHVSKYYIASPPVRPKKNSKWGNKFDIGLVIPDQFTFNGEAPVQEVYLDYTPLKPQLTYEIPFKLDSSVVNSLITHIPFKVESTNFPWNDTPRIKNGKGASGIGFFQPGKGKDVFNSNRFFLPYTKNNHKDNILNTEVTLLNDIMLLYEFKFLVPDPKNNMNLHEVSTINLKKYFESIEQYFDKKKDSITNKKSMVKLIAKRRTPGDIPCGCQSPVAKDGPYGK
ncbi:hypothetical protein [Flavicella sp.]|uniref:hypothetical protein n=1 Tax=Flavicella sp. TaxID=2957742 RepID=UPI002634329E|nr:hypothetical protein [Flavicella sp.]MDG1805042.1 hypothetical protein [Flavicella sp.]MDG2280679.1 hypothetical protein [Flavicella sp.]